MEMPKGTLRQEHMLLEAKGMDHRESLETQKSDMKHEDCGPQGELGLEDHHPGGGGDLHGGAQARGGRAEVRLDGDGGVDTEEISEISTISEPVP